MKRDMDLVRSILLEVEKSTHPMGMLNLELPGQDQTVISYHVMLLKEAGLIEATNLTSSAGYSWKARRLTWEGHEFLDNARSDTVWKKTKSKISDAVGSASLEVVKQVLKQVTLAAVAQIT